MKYKGRHIQIVHISEDGEVLILYKDTGEQELIWEEDLEN
jgi:hypothetical protein